MSSKLWQHPYVNILKHFGVGEWKKCTKEGDVSALMDKQVKGTIYRISGSIPPGNYIQFPRTTSQTLGLTGRYLYLTFKPIPTKYFVVHIDVAAHDGSAVRISFSNLFKEFKSTSTWLQFPFVSNPSPTSVEAKTSSDIQVANLVGKAPQTSRWTLLVLDFHYILSVYLNHSFAYVKNIRLCANMFLRGLFTSDVDYQPGLSSSEARKLGLLAEGVIPLPKEMAFPQPKGSDWQTVYDYVRFPPDKINTRLGIITSVTEKRIKSEESGNKSQGKREKHSTLKKDTVKSKTFGRHKEVKLITEPVHVDEPVSDRHVYATIHRPSIRQKIHSQLKDYSLSHQNDIPVQEKKSKSLKPDPILSLKKIVGFGGGTYRDGLWNINGTHVVYPSHAIIVSMEISSGKQDFLVGHTDKVSALTFDGSAHLLASAQKGKPSLIRIWKYHSRKCISLFRTQVFDITCLSLSYSGNILCAVGHDSGGKQLVVVWDTSQSVRGGQINLLAKAHTDVDINRMRIADFDDSRMISCGRENIRFWRLRNGSLRSCPIELRQHSGVEFTDITFGIKHGTSTVPSKIFCSTSNGSIFQVDYSKIIIDRVYKLLPIGSSHGNHQVSINVLVVNDLFCATGSSDGYLRLWASDFSKVLLEAEHEGSITFVNVSRDGGHILAGTNMGNLGILNTSTRSYKTIMRSHTNIIYSMSMDPGHRRLATASADHTIRIWDMDTLTQLYDFQAPDEEPCVITFHPIDGSFACGFTDGTVRVFDVLATSLVAEHKQHKGRVTGLVFSPNGRLLFSAGALGAIAMYSVNDNDYELVRMLLDMTPRNIDMGPNALSMSIDGRKLAFIGPTEYTVCVVDARSLDEVLRVDITTIASQGHIDTAILVAFSTPQLNHLLVMTSSNRLLKLDASNGMLLSEVSNIHRKTSTCLDTSSDGRYLATSGDNLIKIWDYHMRLDINFQVFIGHSNPVNQIFFTPGNHEVISVGEAILMWQFNGRTNKLPPSSNTDVINVSSLGHKDKTPQRNAQYPKVLPNTSQPRVNPPKPTTYEPIELDLSPVRDTETPEKIETEMPQPLPSRLETSMKQVKDKEIITVSFQESPKKAEVSLISNKDAVTSDKPPNVCKHYKSRLNKTSVLAKCRYTAPPNQAGLKLKSVLGYNGEGRKNMIWKYDTGLFAYSNGAIIVIEDLHSGKQRHLVGHTEDVSTLTVQNDSQVLASASGSSPSSTSQICIWKVKDGSCDKVLTYHKHEVINLSYSRDDRFLISVGDYRECSIVVWSTANYEVITSSYASQPIHDLQWDPYRVNEFVTVGHNGCIVFWLLDESSLSFNLNMHEPEVPGDIIVNKADEASGHLTVISKPKDEASGHFTAICYANDFILYAATSDGLVFAWDTQQNKCFIHWKADKTEIDVLVFGQDHLVTGGCSSVLKIWSVIGVNSIRTQGDNYRITNESLVMEDEMNMDGAIISASFDDNLQTGIVGTTVGTLWYVNWAERTSIRLVSGHAQEIKSVVFSSSDDKYFATCGTDGVLHLWTTDNLEHLQFQVMNQSCNCVAFCPIPEAAATTNVVNQGQTLATVLPQTSPESRDSINQSHCVAGYGDGTVRMFDLGRVEMIMKMQPHATAVTHIAFSPDGRVIISGASDGIIAISSPSTGLTVRLLNDHKGAPISDLHSTIRDRQYSVSSPMLWLAASKDSRVSIWSAKWSQDFCELVDWLSFPTPSIAPDGKALRRGDLPQYDRLPPSLARFSPSDPDIVIFTGYSMQRAVQFYSLTQRKVIRTAVLTHWATSMDVSPLGNLIAFGTHERLVQMMDYDEGRFQDFVGPSDTVSKVCFSPTGKLLYAVSYLALLAWDVVV